MYRHFQCILEADDSDRLVAILTQKLQEVSPETTIMFSGHSMGATIALLTAESFRSGDLKKKSGVKFSHSLKLLQVASPASFDQNARQYIQEHWGDSSLSIERFKDPVSWWFASN